MLIWNSRRSLSHMFAESAQDYCCLMFAWTGLTIDCADPQLLARFWAGVLNRPITYEMGVTEDWATVGSRKDAMPRLNFQRVPERKTTKVRVHIDLSVDDLEQAIDLVERLGGTWSGTRLVYDEGTVVHMADPEGNEFCMAQYNWDPEVAVAGSRSEKPISS
jgi:predicted enzyme related to lactoylglutathione lyase